MLRVLRESIKGWTAKIFLGVLAIMFVFWGVGDGWFQNSSTLAFKVGDTEYSVQQWESIVRERIEYLKRDGGTQSDLNSQELRSYIMQQTINQALLTEESKRLDILIGDEAVKYEILNSLPNLVRDGKFDRELLLEMLKNAGISEAHFVARMREELARKFLIEVISSGRLVNDILLTQIATALTAEREIQLFEVDDAHVIEYPKPTEDDLINIINNNKDRFIIPESRSISYFTLDQNLKLLADNGAISEDEIQKFYQERAYLFQKPESRSIAKLVFKDKRAAEEAYEQLIQGETFHSLAKTLKQVDGFSPSAPVTYDGFDEQIAQAIFSLKKGDFSKPVHTPLGWYIFLVSDIIPAIQEDIEKVRSEIIKSLLEHRRYERYTSLVQSMEREIESGIKLEDLANKYWLKVVKVHIKQGVQDSNLVQKFGDEVYNKFMQDVFAANEGEIKTVQKDEHDALILFTLDRVQHSTLPAVSAIEGAALALWKQNYADSVAQDMLIDARQKILDGADIKTLPGIKSKKIKLSFMEANTELSTESIRQIFLLMINQSTTLLKNLKGKVVFAKVLGVKEADSKTINDTVNEKIRPSLNLREMIVAEYLEALRNIYDIKIFKN